MDHVAAPKIEDREMQPISEEQVRTIIEAARATKLEIPVLLAALTGLRRGELLAIRWKSVDFERGHITINEALEQTRTHGVRFKPPKSRSSRRVLPVADELLSVLREHKAKQNAERLRLGPAYVDQDLVFCNGDGSPWSPDTFSKQFAGIMRFVGIKGFRFHDVRHAFASITLKNGSSVKEVSTLLGHSSPMLTLSTYAHVMEGMGREAVNGLARSLLAPAKVA